jgi:hypothetical protein
VLISVINILRLRYLCSWNIKQAARYLNPALEPYYYDNYIDYRDMATEHLCKALNYLVELGYDSQNSGYFWYYGVIKHIISRLGWLKECYLGQIMNEIAVVCVVRVGESYRYIYYIKTPWSLLNK